MAKRIVNKAERNAERYSAKEVGYKLYADSKADKVFDRLMPLVVAEQNVLLAYRNICKNGGSKTPGTDGKTIVDIQKLKIDEVIKTVNDNPKPLALYVFARDKKAIKAVTEKCAFGGGCVNDVIIHLATSRMGFGGVGESGMGSYHGKSGFDTFSHKKSIVDKKLWLDLPMRYQPFKRFNEFLIHLFLR